MSTLKFDTMERALKSDLAEARDIAVRACKNLEVPTSTIKKWLRSSDYDERCAGVAASIKNLVPVEWLFAASQKYGDIQQVQFYRLIRKALGCHDVPMESIRELANSPDCLDRRMAMMACRNQDAPIELIIKSLEDDSHVSFAAAEACRWRFIPVDLIDEWRHSEYWNKRYAAMMACIDRAEVPFRWPAEELERNISGLDYAAAEACATRRIPNRWLNRWLAGPLKGEALALVWNFGNRLARDPLLRCKQTAKRWLNVIQLLAIAHYSELVRAEAVKAYDAEFLPIIRAFEPPEYVYKKCVSGVMVVAKITDDAQIRGTRQHVGRASKAEIVDVIGDFFGEKVGVSHFDHETTYRIGDTVTVDNFDMTEGVRETGFYFFSRREEAERYIY